MQPPSRQPRACRIGSFLVATLLALLLVPVAAAPALACSCIGWTEAEALAWADVAFTGQVASITEPKPNVFGGMESTAPVTATIVVDAVYKGDVSSRTTVTTAMDGASCGFEFVADVRYLVFGSYGGDSIITVPADELTANLCGGTRVLDGAAPSLGLADLGVAAPALPGTGERPRTPFPLLGWVALAGIGGLGLTTAGLWARMRRICRPA